MKNIIILFLILITTIGYSQTQIKAGVYATADQQPDSKGTRKILAGETRFFRFFELSLITLPEKKDDLPVPAPAIADWEQVIIVKEGELRINLGQEKKVLSPNGVAHILSGDQFAFENTGDTPVTFYLMRYVSRAFGDKERGKINGGSVAIRWEDVEKRTTDKGFSRVFYNHPTSMTTKFDMHATTLKKGVESHPPHTHSEEEIVLMLRGKGRMNIGGKFYDVAPGHLIYLSSEKSHAIENSGNDECEYFAFQWK